MRTFHILRKDTKRKLEGNHNMTSLEFIQSLTLTPEEVSKILDITERQAKRILSYDKLPTEEQLQKLKEVVDEISRQ